MLSPSATDFWKWFIKHSHKLQSSNYEPQLFNELDKKITRWGLGWEIGPGSTKKNSLTISANGDKSFIDVANMIIEAAPTIENWEFYNSKQPKENWALAKLIGRNIEVNAEDWTYVLLTYPDEKTEILIKADNLSGLANDDRELVVDLVLTNLLGETAKIKELDFIEVIDEFDSDKGITQLKFLPAHLHKIRNDE